MYTVENFKTKKALKEAVASGVQVDTFQPGDMFLAQTEGTRSRIAGTRAPA